VVLPAGDGDRWLLGIEWDPTREHLADYTPARLADFTARAAGVPTLVARIEHVGTFSFAAQIADRFRHGDVFLVGDAAHRISPRGGTGMNTAIADGFDLAWRLAWVHKGWAGPALLDRYEAERRPLVEHNLTRSADADGSRRDALTESHVDLGGRLTHHWLPTSSGPRRSTLDLVGPGLTLFSGPDGSAWARAATATAIRTAVPISPVAADPVTARALGIVGDGALLVRPDGVPVASWSTPTAAPARLREAISGITDDRRPDQQAA
jgi:hypothetical protein